MLGVEAVNERALTIVVPIYDHWSSLARCIDALVRHTDPRWMTVLLVNDNGPHGDTIEELVLAEIDGKSWFRYFRNPTNLGFVQTCNRAVFELDTTSNDILLLNSDTVVTAGAIEELVEVLHLDEHHATVCPRTNNASIATMPFARRHGAPAPLTPDASVRVAQAVGHKLPRYMIAPVSVGFCMLIRRSVISTHGLFDEAYGRGYNEENDFCMRINALGYSSLLANWAWVEHVGSTSFATEKHDLDARNAQLLAKRYPHYFPMVHEFLRYGYGPEDHFSEVIADLGDSPRAILIDVHHLSHAHNGSTRLALAFLAWLAENKPDDVTVVIAAQPGTLSFFSLDQYGFATVPYGESTEVFDLLIAIAPVNSFAQLHLLNRRCARWVLCHFDMIAVRALHLLWGDRNRTLSVGLGLNFADVVVPISEFSLADAASYYPARSADLMAKGVPTLIGLTAGVTDFVKPAKAEVQLMGTLERRPFVLVVGNHYPHKQVAAAVNALSQSGICVVAMGPLEGVKPHRDLHIVASGQLSDAGVARLYTEASLVVFPSSFEGFGLPLSEALDAGTPAIVWDAAISREIVAATGAEAAVRFFSSFGELAGVVKQALANESLAAAAQSMKGRMPSMDEYCQTLWNSARELLDRPVDLERLRRRWEVLVTMEQAAHARRGA